MGTTVEVYFPRTAGGDGEEAPEPVAGERTEGGGRILLVEDEVAVRTLVSRMLRHLGYDVIVAESSLEAVGLFELHARAVTALVTDVVMPQLGGRELAERLLERQPDLRVLFMSGYTEDALLRRRHIPARVAFIEKPFTAADLLHKLAAAGARTPSA